MHSNDSRKKPHYNDNQISIEYENEDFHHLSIPEFSNVNLYNQNKPFLKKNSIHTPDSFKKEKNSSENKKHFEYGTPIANESEGVWKPPNLKGSFQKNELQRQELNQLSNKQIIRGYNQHENNFHNVLYENKKKKPISHFQVDEEKAHQSLLNNRIHGDIRERKSRGSKKKNKGRSKSRKNWSKQRIRQELEKFEEELEDDNMTESLGFKDIEKQYKTKNSEGIRKLGHKKSKRSSLKAINQSYHQGMGRKRKSRKNSRKMNKNKKGHNRRISTQLVENSKLNAYKQKMIRSQMRTGYSSQKEEQNYIRDQIDWNSQSIANTPISYRNPDYIDRRRQHKIRQMRSSRDIEREPVQNHIRQSFEQNNIPNEMDHQDNWSRIKRMNLSLIHI